MPVELSVETLKGVADRIAEIDSRLDQSAGSDKAAKSALIDKRIPEYSEAIQNVQDGMTRFFEAPSIADDPDALVVILAATQRYLRGYDKQVEDWFKSHDDEIKAALIKLTPDEVKELTEQRKNELKTFRGFKDILEAFHEDTSGVKEPTGRRGVRGKRGPRAISLYTWEVDGVRQPAESDSLAGVASQNGYESGPALRKLMKDGVKDEEGNVVVAPINLTTPPEVIEYRMKNGKLLVGKKRAQDVDDEDEDDETSEDDDESTESDEETSASDV